ncbi:CDK5 and ABL1 enzyme substrate 2 isoform X1 [Geospiza fortis]|uniref:CDK5 and ABL1 enzyme substrate 2 isoform X1 n=1 Tax=Geospiza fortis TaxID=48883 RepID=A0A8N5ESZ1_GEOFO|nr:CDK5 and ABL1 enzyme substrate 2 isoform X1 [Geospiza fortis]
MHFIKNMRQYDTKNSRIVLICAKRTLCVAFSILPYGEGLRISDLKMEGQKQRHPSGGVSVSTEMVLGLEGVELGADGKVVSYAKFLYPTNALVVRKADAYGAVPPCRASAPRSLPGSRYKPVTAKTIPAGTDIGSEAGEAAEYDPNLLDDPQWPCGKHKRVLIFASYMTTVIEYVKPSDLKKDMNETFREKFPHIKLTLSKIRSLKREMRNLSEECSLEPVTVSMAYVYFEKLVLQGKLNKQNRKLCAGACVLLAAKISSDLRKHEVKHLIDKRDSDSTEGISLVSNSPSSWLWNWLCISLKTKFYLITDGSHNSLNQSSIPASIQLCWYPTPGCCLWSCHWLSSLGRLQGDGNC